MANKKSKEFMYRHFFACLFTVFVFIHNFDLIFLPLFSVILFLSSYFGVKCEWFFWPMIMRFCIISVFSGLMFYCFGGFWSFLGYSIFSIFMAYYSFVVFFDLFKEEKDVDN